METVLLPVTNHNQWTQTVAETIANMENQAEAVVVYRFTDQDIESTAKNLNMDLEAMDIDELAARKSGVDEVVQYLEQNDIKCMVRGVKTTDTSGEAILSASADTDADRIYMYSRKRSPAGKAIFGSGLQYVLLNATVPVVVIPSNVS